MIHGKNCLELEVRDLCGKKGVIASLCPPSADFARNDVTIAPISKSAMVAYRLRWVSLVQ